MPTINRGPCACCRALELELGTPQVYIPLTVACSQDGEISYVVGSGAYIRVGVAYGGKLGTAVRTIRAANGYWLDNSFYVDQSLFATYQFYGGPSVRVEFGPFSAGSANYAPPQPGFSVTFECRLFHHSGYVRGTIVEE